MGQKPDDEALLLISLHGHNHRQYERLIEYAVTQENHMLVGEHDIDAEGSDTR